MFNVDTKNIIEHLITMFIGGWWTWVSFGLLRLKKDMNAAHKKLRSKDDVANTDAASLAKDSHTDFD